MFEARTAAQKCTLARTNDHQTAAKSTLTTAKCRQKAPKGAPIPSKMPLNTTLHGCPTPLVTAPPGRRRNGVGD